MTVAELITLLRNLAPDSEVAILGRNGTGERFIGVDLVPGGVYLLSERSATEPFPPIGSKYAPRL